MNRARERNRRDLLYDDPLDCGIYTLARDRRAPDETRTVSEVHRVPVNVAAYGLFAGHGGPAASELCARNFVPTLLDDDALKKDPERALRNACAALEAFVLAKSALDCSYYGTTLLFSLIQGKDLYIANIGNSRAVIATRDGVQTITHEHDGSNPDEVARVRNAGGFFQDGRVNDLLEVTRSIGDLELKGRKHITFPNLKMTEDIIIASPDIYHRKISAQDEFIVMATADVWEILSNKAVAQIVQESLRKGDNPRSCAKRVATAAMAGGARGPLTVMLLIFAQQRPIQDKIAAPPRRRTSRPSALKRHSSNAEQELRSRNNQAKAAAATPAFVLQAQAEEKKRLAIEESIIQSSPVTSPAGPKVLTSGSGGSNAFSHEDDIQISPFPSLNFPPAHEERPSSIDQRGDDESQVDGQKQQASSKQLPRAQSVLGIDNLAQGSEYIQHDEDDFKLPPSRRQIDTRHISVSHQTAEARGFLERESVDQKGGQKIVTSRISELTASGATGGADSYGAYGDMAAMGGDMFDSNPSGPSKVRYREDGTVNGGRLGFLKELSKTFVRRR